MSNWFWFTENEQLMLSMGKEWQCTTAFGKKQIVDMPDQEQLFSLQDTECYLSLLSHLMNWSSSFSEAQLAHILINATAAIHFHKPISPKSWYFAEIENYGVHHRFSRLSNEFGEGVVLVLTDEHQLATCMLISSGLKLTNSKVLNRFELIKVAINRLEPFLLSECDQLTA
ncbi:cell division protein ZapC [Paraglaciecola aquimarina]|uniref:Cell division protein ZapC n=1 Tax=Paraglaciecola aquimarina TaxID=1235557 RepID=A0ABU3SYZ2_9ALTE|nr:cell division protein ZapC domain-containing protein [Paraglaciecola aquimarina]MDU0355187.1 cell division protein ZapC [Paraglaciecola aquimarina]